MTALSQIIARFRVDETGATVIEYALIAAGISLAIAAALPTIGSNVGTIFTAVGASI